MKQKEPWPYITFYKSAFSVNDTGTEDPVSEDGETSAEDGVPTLPMNVDEEATIAGLPLSQIVSREDLYDVWGAPNFIANSDFGEYYDTTSPEARNHPINSSPQAPAALTKLCSRVEDTNVEEKVRLEIIRGDNTEDSRDEYLRIEATDPGLQTDNAGPLCHPHNVGVAEVTRK